MRRATLRVEGSLSDFLPPARRGRPFGVEFELPLGLRDLVQSVGIPHVEVEQALVDGRKARWTAVVDDGARIDLAPRYPLSRPLPEARFVLDVHLGKLARHLRLIGYDAEHDPDADDPSLVLASNRETRILLTRDLGLLMRASLRQGSYIRSMDPLEQGREAVGRFALAAAAEPFTRCLVCNGMLVAVDPSDTAVPPGVTSGHDDLRRCGRCGRTYWRGSHHEHLTQRVRELLAGDPRWPARREEAAHEE